MAFGVLLKRRFPAGKITAVFLAFSIACSSFLMGAPAFAQSSPAITVVSPAYNASVNGKLTFSFRVSNLAATAYIPFWAVDNGVWNVMAQSSQDPTLVQATVDVSGWNWQHNHTYTLSFIALQTANWQPIIVYVPIQVDGSVREAPSVAAAQSLVEATAPVPSSKKLYADPTGNVAVQAEAWAQSHPEDAAAMRYLSTAPLGNWFGDWNGDVRAAADAVVTRATSANALPVMVTYNIPHRDCGSYSAGGVTSGDAYRQWINAFADGIGMRDAIVVLEPDALAGMDCLSQADQTERVQLLHTAITTLKQRTHATVYVDAGNPTWQSPANIAKRLTDAGIADADGFSLNVSNFVATSANVSYGTKISSLLHNTHFVIDTGRNGSGAGDGWCNPAGRTVGELPTLNTGNDLVDAYLWVKSPGESDGTCGPTEAGTSAPGAGQWWPQYAQALLRSVTGL